MKVYLLVAKEFLQSGILGVFSKREDAEKQKARCEKINNSPKVFSMTTFEIFEVPFDSTEIIDKNIEDFKKELGLD